MIDLFIYAYAAISTAAIATGLYMTTIIYLEERKK